MFSGIEATSEHKTLIKKIPNATFVDSISSSKTVTHVVVDPSNIRRTAKLMACLCSSTCENVMGLEWVIESAKVSDTMELWSF